MPFLLPLIPAAIAGAGSAAVGAGVNAIGSALAGGQSNPQQANTTSPVTAQQAQQAGQQVQSGINSQQALAQQLASQNGISNQSDVYGQQQALANQLGQMAQGLGPDPASAMLANSTGANVANQAALMAGQRGAGTNVGLIARQAGQQGAATQQQGAGQAAVLKQQQQLNAINALQGQQGQLANLATQQVGQQANAVSNLNNFAQGNQGQVFGAMGQNNSNLAGQQSNINSINAANQQQNVANAQRNAAGVTGGLGAANVLNAGQNTQQKVQGLGTSLGFAEGGQVPSQIAPQANLKEHYSGSGPKSRVGMHLRHKSKFMANGGMVDVVLSPGEKVLSPEAAQSRSIDSAKVVPGTPKVSGAKNSYANDTVPTQLKEGSVVLPRSVTQAKDPKAAEAKFIEALMSKKKKSR